MDEAGGTAAPRDASLHRLQARLRALYHGKSKASVRFRLSVIVLDLALIVFFIAAPFFRDQRAYLIADYVIAAILIVDLVARALATPNLKRWLTRPVFLADVAVLVTLLFPLTLSNFAFLRVLRLWSLVNSDFFWATIARRYDNTRWEETIKALGAMLTYLFIATGLVYALYARRDEHIASYLDALYFTVTTATTTGFGDVTLPGASGKIVSIIIMVSGISLFVRLVQALVRPNKVRFQCPACGLMRHDLDASHCKACGTLLNIPNDE